MAGSETSDVIEAPVLTDIAGANNKITALVHFT
jgi:hypothetical protein